MADTPLEGQPMENTPMEIKPIANTDGSADERNEHEYDSRSRAKSLSVGDLRAKNRGNWFLLLHLSRAFIASLVLLKMLTFS